MKANLLWCAMFLALAACGDAVSEQEEVGRVRDHLERVERELRAETPAGLTGAQRAARAETLDLLHKYIAAGRYPRNHLVKGLTPIFIDDSGARCAMAALLEATGEGALVERVARTHNRAYVEELKDFPDLRAWLAAHGLSLVEAARIQPAYFGLPPRHRFQLTFHFFAGLKASETTAGGVQPAVVAPGVRFGVRHSNPRDARVSLLAEYSWSYLVGAGGANNLALLLHLHRAHGALHPFYLIGGPLASLAGGRQPGIGAELGIGYYPVSFGVLPMFVEVMGAGLAQGDRTLFRGGLNVGIMQ